VMCIYGYTTISFGDHTIYLFIVEIHQFSVI